jgi:DNA-binding IclR family transcriptional regulator
MSIQSIERAAAILRCLSSGPRRLGVSELSTRLGLAKWDSENAAL